MTRTWAIELGKEYGGLTANAVVLGLVDTDLWRALPEGRRKYWEGVLMERNAVNGRIGNVKDVAGVVGWLVSSEAAWVSGQCLAVGGGGLMIG
jgi:NAD(P)-dependent dehydrogenase (short-subunit alcohol dehydrogenase family)